MGSRRLYYIGGLVIYYHRLKFVAVLLQKLSKYITNIDVPPTAQIGPGIAFLHGCSIVVGPYVEVGTNVIIRPLTVLRGWGTVKLEDNVRVGMQSIVMDNVTMGQNSESAPGSIVTVDVPAGHIAFGVPAKRMIPREASNLRGVVIELENVLLEATPVFDEALSDVFRQAGKSLPNSKKSMLTCLPPESIIDKLCAKEPAKKEKMLADYMEAIRADLGHHLQLRPHGRELIEKLRERGLQIAAISHQPDILAKEIVEMLGVDQLF